MSESQFTEQQFKAACSELAQISVDSLKKIFVTPPLDKSWAEIEQRISQGEQLKDICELEDDYLESVYQEGKGLLEREEAADAKEIFSSLCLYDQRTPKYWAGLGKSCELLKYYPEAVRSYQMLLITTGGTAELPYLCLGYCYLCLGKKDEALEVLETGREICDPSDYESRPVLEQFEELIALCK
ncbi:MAG: hypothetical protein K6F05_04430 [Succinivibrio sp.]|nr:hypothetical protein [Succinivibrio sp.]